MELSEMIFRRKSVRKYKNEPVDEAIIQKINSFCTQAKPLYPEIKVRAEIIGKENVKCLCPWTTSEVIAVFSEKKKGYLENAGFIFQQLELYRTRLGSEPAGWGWAGLIHMPAAAKTTALNLSLCSHSAIRKMSRAAIFLSSGANRFRKYPIRRIKVWSRQDLLHRV